jgi:hypothetical protein
VDCQITPRWDEVRNGLEVVEETTHLVFACDTVSKLFGYSFPPLDLAGMSPYTSVRVKLTIPGIGRICPSTASSALSGQSRLYPGMVEW